MNKINTYALILLTGGMLGGAEKRFAQLFRYLSLNYPDKYYFLITWGLYYKILEIFPNYPTQNLLPIGFKISHNENLIANQKINKTYSPNHPGIIKQIYRFVNNYRLQKKYYIDINRIRKEKDIKCFLGIYNGIIPLYFYLKQKKRDVGIVFCDMDSWFDDVLPREKKYWYRKYSSFNFGLENSDHIDFLSPFILEGIRDRGIKVREESVSITPCSFTDYSKCKIGDKTSFQVVFAGRLEKDKNPEIFIEAAVKLSKKYPEILFHIMGEGGLSLSIKEKVKSSQFSNIIFHGFHPQPTEIMADASVFVSIQTTNNYPSQSVLEAMACGNAIIATDVGDTRMFINQLNGLLISLDVTELAKAIERLYLDKDLRKQLGRFAYSYVRENHTIEKMAEYYVNLFNKTSSGYIN